MKLKRTFLILLVLLCVASVGFASVSAASDDFASDDASLSSIDDNAIDEVILDDTDDSLSDSIQTGLDDSSQSDSIQADSDNSKDKSLGASPLSDGGTSIYVSTTGDDSKDGSSEENAVATIAKAYELAGDGSTINIAAGTYEQSSSITLSKSVTFNGVDGAIIKRTGTANVFSYSGDSETAFTFNNIIFTSPTKQNNAIFNIGGAGVVNLNSCKFTDSTPGNGNGLVKFFYNAKGTLDSCDFYGLSGSSGQQDFVAISGNSIVTVKDSKFHDMDLSFLRSLVYVNSNSAKGIVTGCKFFNISGNPMGLVETKGGALTVSNCRFEDNELTGSNVKGLIYISETNIANVKGDTLISANSFSNNDAKYAIWISAAPVTAEYNAFDLADGQFAIGNNKNANVTVNCNFFGTNDNPSAVLDNVSASNWVVMSASASESSVSADESITITADFSKCTNGTATSDVTGTMAEVPVKFINADSTKGSISEVSYENNKAIVSYTGIAEGDDSVTVSAGSYSTTIPIAVTANVPAGNVIYVKPDGNDENDGLTKSTPVKTIAKAVEIVKAAEGEAFTINIANGEYSEGTIALPEEKSISFIGAERDKVIISSNTTGNNKYFFSKNTGASNFAFKNLVLTGLNSGSTSMAIKVGGTGTVDIIDCTFKDITAKVAVQTYTTGDVNIKNTTFKNILAPASAAWGALYFNGDSKIVNIEDVLIDGVSLSESAATQYAYDWGAIYIYGNMSKVTIKNSNFTNVRGVNDAVIASRGGLDLIGCSFYNNTIAKTSAGNYGYGLIHTTYEMANVNIEDSSFFNNTVYALIQATRGNVTVRNSAFYDNLPFEGSNLTYVNASSSYSKNVTANFNWWGTNDNPNSAMDSASVANWVIMNVEPASASNIDIDGTVAIAVDFNHYTDGTAVSEMTGSIPELKVTASATTGNLDKAEAITENGQANFIYTALAGGEDAVNIASSQATVPVAISVNLPPVPQAVYVSKEGNDENNGEESSPVATIAKAIELASSDAGNGTIYIKEGSYTENNFNISSDLEIIGIGDVVIDGNNENRIFTVNSGVESFTLKNLAVTKANRNYGSVIYSSGAKILLDNVTLYENQATTGYSSVSVIYANGGSVEIDNSVIANHSADGMLYINGAKLVINNTSFDNNNANLTDSGTLGFIFTTGATSVSIESSNFTRNIDRQGLIYDSNSANEIVIKDCIFDGNTATVGAGAVIHSNGKVNVMNSVFTNNNAGREGGAIYLGKNADANVTKSVFINNTCSNYQTGYNGEAISSAGKLNINYSILLASEGSAKALLYNANENTAPNADYNWWGTNDKPTSLIAADSYYDDWEEEDVTCPMPVVSKWVVMTVSNNLSAESIDIGDEVEIAVDFNHYTDGTAVSEMTESIPEIEVKAAATNGNLDKDLAMTENGQVKFTYTAAAAGEDIANIESGSQTVPVAINVVSTAYEGIIYVSKDGSDSNNGAEDKPVATIAKAVELAKAGSGQIIIKEGTYNENNINIDGDKSISIKGEGNVVIDGTGLEQGSIFNIVSSVVSFENIKFTNNKAESGGAIYVHGTSDSNLLIVNMVINNCTFDKLEATSRGGAIYTYYTKGNLLINNTKFINNNASSWGGAICAGYSAYENGLTLRINNTAFDNNYANNGGAGYLQADRIIIENSNFTKNSAKYYPGALELYNCTATIDNSIFTGNNASKQSAAIKVEGVKGQPITTATITNCVIEDNVGRDAKAAAIYVDKSSLVLSYSSIVNEHGVETVTSQGYDAVYGQGIATLNNNWWGTNDPSAKVNGTNITMDNWVIMNVEANASEVQAGDEVKLTVDFNHVMTKDGSIEELSGGSIPKESYSVELSAENGTAAPVTLLIPKGESKEAIFTAEGPNAKVTASCGEAVKDIVFAGEVPEPYTGIVYVSKDGSDSNNGSEDAPVASIAKAIAIATAETGSGQIIVKEGSYTGTDYQITKDLSIIGEGNVVINGEGKGRLFYMSYGADVNSFTLANMTLTGAKNGYGAAVYTFAKETLLENITIVNNPGAGDLITSYGNLTIKNCEITGHNGGDVIQTSGNANIIISNTVFKDNEVTESTSDYGIVYISSGKGNLTIEDSKFINNKARQGIVIGASDTNITVKGTEFINNTNTVSYGGAIRASSKLDVTESIFINNHAKRDGGAVYIGFRGDATITKSEFINNSVEAGYHGDAIYNGNKATVNYCILLTNASSYLIYNDGEDNVVNAQYNWWGTNDNPKSLNGKGYYEDDYGYDEIECADVDSSNWIVMNVVADSSNAKAGSEIPVSADFNHYLDSTTSEIKELDTKLAQELTVDFSSTKGSFDKTSVETENLVAQSKYTAVEGENNIAVKSSDAEISMEFNAVKTVPTNLAAEEDVSVVFGQGSLEITLTAEGSPLEGKTITVKVNDEISLTGTTDENGIAAIDLSAVPVGTYNAEISFAEDGQYEASSASVKITVNEAPKTAQDLQKLIDETPEGGVLNLSNVEFADVSDINITKDISIVGDNLTIATAGDGKAVFNVASNVSKASISGVDFVANNGDVLVKAEAVNGTDDLSIVNPAIELSNNTVSKANDDVVASSITLFELESERAVLAPTNDISIKDNALPEGAKSFDFEIAGLNNGSGVNIPKGGSVNANASGKSSSSAAKLATKIVAKTMKTTTVNTKINGKKAGKNFSITLKDSKGNVLAGKQVLIALNGKIYKRTTNAKGVASLKVALSKKGTYPVVISFLGDDKYNGSFAVAKVKVNPQKVKLTVAKKKYKANKKAKYLVATLKAANKKAIKGKKLVFIVNKKKYTAKTNKKGIAKVKVKLSKKGTYKFTVKFAGDNTFKKISRKGKVLIK